MPKGSFSFSWQNSFRCLNKTPWTNSEKYRILYLNMFCVWQMSTVTILGNCLVWLMSGSGKDNRWNLTIPTLMCVGVCFCVVLALFFLSFFCQISSGQGTYCTLFNPPRLYTLLNIKRWIRSHPPDTTLPHLFVSAADGANNNVCSEEMDCFSSVPMKKPRQLSWIPPKSNGTDPNTNYKLWTLT